MIENQQNDWEKSVQLYSKEIAKLTTIYSKEEEKEIIFLAQNGDIEARNKIIKSHLRFVFNVAKNYKGRGLCLGELISEGNLGLIKALDDFDLSKDIKFITYAVWWIKAYIRQAIDGNQEISNKEMLSDDYVSDNDDKYGCERLNNISDTNLVHLYKERDEAIQELISKLSEREQNIIKAYFGLGDNGKPQTFKEIAKINNLSTERVRQMYHEAIKNMRYNIFAIQGVTSFNF